MTPIRETIARALFATRFSAEWETDRWARARAMCRDEADDVLRALDEAGMVVVPREPTEAMQVAGAAIWRGITGQTGRPRDKHPITAEAYRAMISASVVE
jgi:hypothetical protein